MSAVLLQEPTFFCLLAGARVIRTADTVYVGRRVPLATPSPRALARTRRWVRLLNARATVVELPLEAVTRHLWQLNEEAVGAAQALAPAIRATRAYRIARGVIEDDALVKYFQAALVRRLPNAPLLRALAAALGDAEIDVVASWDSVEEGRETQLHRLARLASALRSACAAGAVPLVDAARRLRHGLARRGRRRFKVAVPVVWGVKPDDGTQTEGVRRPQDDRYLYGASFTSGDIVHVFSDWRLDGARRAQTLSALRAQQLPFVERDRAGFDPRLIGCVLRAAWGGVRLLAPPAWRRLDAMVAGEIPKAFYTYLKKHAECLAAPADVAVVKDDYNPGHVIGTIACHERGTRTFGIQHVASACDAPQLAFVHVDRHAVYAPMLAAAFGAHWPPGMLERVGRESIDWVAEVAQDRAGREALRERWRATHGATGTVILVLFPGDREICLARQWDEMYQGLLAFSETDAAATVVLRFRTAASLDSPHVARFAGLPARDARFVVEMSVFTTYELLAIADFVVAPEASFTINEASAAGVPVVTFEYVGTATRYFGCYGRDFVLRTAGDVARVLAAAARGRTRTLACDWARLAADANYFTDGHNRERVQRAVRRLVDGTDAAPIAAERLSVSA